MNITEQQLANAAKALGIDAESLEDKWSNGEKFAEWAVPRLEYDHGDAINIWPDSYEGNGKKTSWMASGGDNYGSGPDIDTAVFLLAAKIGEGME